MKEPLDNARVPTRAGRCWCGQRYNAQSLNVIRAGGRWQHLGCVASSPENDRLVNRRKRLIKDIEKELP